MGNPAMIVHNITVATTNKIIKQINSVINITSFHKEIKFFREKKKEGLARFERAPHGSPNGNPCMLPLNTIRVVNSTITFSSIYMSIYCATVIKCQRHIGP